ncbi:MAG: ATP-binding protein [Polyangiaceae bacterium]
MRRAGTIRLLPLATSAVVLVGVLVAVVMALLGVVRLRRTSDLGALDKAHLLAQTAAVRVAATAAEDRLRLLDRIGERAGADAMVVDLSGRLVADTLVGEPPSESIESMLVAQRGFVDTSTGRAAYAVAEVGAPFRNLAVIVFVHAPAAPSSTRPFGKAVAWLAITLVSAASGAAYAFARSADDDVEYLRKRIDQMASAGAGPVAEKVPIRTLDQVGALTAAFNAMVDRFTAAERAYNADLAEADSLDQARARFLAVLSHEMRTPLHGVLGFADVLLSEVDGPLSASAREDVEIIRQSAENLRGLIDDILELSAIETGNLRLERRTHDLRVIGQRALKESSSLAVKKGLTLTLDAPAPVMADIDSRRIRQILVNLISNAIKFTTEGSVVVRVSQREGMGVIEVIDTGPGIQPNELALIFEEFKQVGDITSQRKGTGLGLAIARRLARMHDGSLTASSELGHGACFRLELPLAPIGSRPADTTIDPLDSFAKVRVIPDAGSGL